MVLRKDEVDRNRSGAFRLREDNLLLPALRHLITPSSRLKPGRALNFFQGSISCGRG